MRLQSWLRMSAVSSGLLVLSACVTAVEPPASAANGAVLYGYRCKGCHEPATPGAPNFATLSSWETGEVLKSMTNGRMKYLVPDMSRQEMRDVATYITSSRP